ncbi:hypothetical protein L208DRAFT_1370317 [Tricholoma matsutake]|nr:hypothetical protein L208DRAFT_1370317 [Tricholoma matsutake 945]
MECVRHLEEDLELQRGQWVAEVAKKGRNIAVTTTTTQTYSANAPSTTRAPNTMSVSPSLPHLTDQEKTLLTIHRGCFKCRIFYAGHMSHECPIVHASVEACKNVTAENAMKARNTFDARTASIMHVVALFGDSNNEDYFEQGGDKDNECLSPSLTLPQHLKWRCRLDVPMTCALTPITVLIDHGCPPVLISSELVENMGLATKKLFKAMSVSGAFTKGERKLDSKLILSNYYEIHIQSPDSVWKSCIINTIICPKLHTDLILGLDFLVRSHVVVDAKMCMAVVMETGYDMLNPPTLSRETAPQSPWLQH